MSGNLKPDTVLPPKHVAIRNYVRQLVEGAPAGTSVPSETVLMAQFGVARMTVRQGMKALIDEGVVETVRGRGTFVSDRKLRIAATLCSYTTEMRRRGLSPSSRTFVVAVKRSGPGIAEALRIPTGRKVVHWRRLRLANAEPMCIEDAYFSDRLMPGFLDRPLPDSLYEELARNQYVLSAGDDAVEAAIASPSEAEVLRLRRDAALLRVSRRAYSGQQPVVVSKSLYRADRYTFLRPLHGA